jgi:uncharacterized protein YjbJ (UPF0337 family)
MASGKADKAKGRMKKAAGDLMDDEELRRRGQADEIAGDVKETVDEGVDRVRGKRKR